MYFSYDAFLQIGSRKHLISLQIFLGSLPDYLIRQRPVVLTLMRGQIVSRKLLVKRSLSAARLILVGRPESGRIGCQDLVSQYHLTVLIETELELGIRYDDALGQSVVCALFIYGQSVVTKLGRILLAVSREIPLENFYRSFKRNVLVMISYLGLGARSVDSFGKLVCLDQAFGTRYRPSYNSLSRCR